MTTANQNWLPIAATFEKSYKFGNVDVEKIVPHKHNTQRQARVKNISYFRPKQSIPFSDRNHSEAITFGAAHT